MHLAIAALVVVPLALGAQIAPGILEGQEGPEPHASWPMLGADIARTFRMETPGSSATFEFKPWIFQDSLQLVLGSEFAGAVIGDMNGDGLEEVAVVSEPFGFQNTVGKLHVWVPSGELVWTTNLSNSVGHPVLIDWNTDGQLEVQVADGPLQRVFGFRGELMWSAPMPYPQSCGVPCAHTGAFDLTGDGVPDILANGDDPIALGDPPILYAVDGKTEHLLWKYHLPCGIGATLPAVLTTPQGPRILTACRSFEGSSPNTRTGVTLFALESRPMAANAEAGLHEVALAWKRDFSRGDARTDLVSVTVGDVTGDGIDELIVSTEAPGNIHVLDANGRTIASWDGQDDRISRIVALAELDGTPGLEILKPDLNGTVAAYDFSAQGVRLLWSRTFTGGIPALAAADFDGDGLDEIVVPLQIGFWCEFDQNGMVLILNARGDTLWQSEAFPKCVQPVKGLALADLDKDGDIEIVAPSFRQFMVFGVGPQPSSIRGQR